MITQNLLLKTDSYKSSHYLQYPKGTTKVFSYFESRGGLYQNTVFFGMLYYLEQLAKGITEADVDEAKEFYGAHGEPFNEEGWRYIARELGGKLPLIIKAPPEGTVVPTHNVLFTVENTDPRAYFLPSYVETMMVRLWYPITVATLSWHCKRIIQAFLERTGDPAEIGFKLHDFGARGVSSGESAALGGAAHLVNFLGSDTVEGVYLANKLYQSKMAGFSIPASEHSTITTWGKDREMEAYSNMLDAYGKPGAIFACVSDSYDIDNAVKHIWGEQLREKVIKSGATVVIRPDSGDPVRGASDVIEALGEKFGFEWNDKGFKILKNVRVIWGDGVDPDSIFKILQRLERYQWSANNIAFGMGGALLQKVHRDTQKCAYKCSWAVTDRGAVEVFKAPIGDPMKKSKAGRQDLVSINGLFDTVVGDKMTGSVLRTVFENGEIKHRDTMDQIREQANQYVK